MIITVVFLIFVCMSISNSKPIYYENITDMEPTDLDTSFRFVFASPQFNTTIIESEENGENAVDIETKYNETEISINKRINDAVLCSLLGRCLIDKEPN